MSNNNQLDFSKFGKNFQEKLAQLMFQDRQFADQLREVLDLNFFELKYLQAFSQKLFDYRDKYDMYPSSSIMNTILRTELDEDNDALNKQIRDYFARILASPEIEDEDYGFVFDSEGNLKFAFVPEFLPDKPPKNIQKIMKILGVIKMLSIDTINENIAQSSLPLLQEIAKLSLSERHKLLRTLIQEMAEDVNNDPELDFFS